MDPTRRSDRSGQTAPVRPVPTGLGPTGPDLCKIRPVHRMHNEGEKQGFGFRFELGFELESCEV